ncbi:MAG: DUF72 domain-containing protein [Planctomycetes bacterium]|nr:DUF72 domain-containing protein [Planctomycetota bacterium]
MVPAHKPPGFHALPFLARYFDGIEIDSSFYAMPRPENARRWAALVAPHAAFRFWVKLHRDFTHAAHEWSDVELESRARTFREGLEPLIRARRLEALLAQFPVSFLFGRSEVRRLGRLRALLDPLPLVLEVRHSSWFTPPAIDTIRGLGYSLAHIDLPPAWNHPPDWHPSTGPIGYLRVHGRNSAQWFREGAERDDRYDYLYGADELRQLARRAERIAAEHDTTAVVTNNHFGGQAVANALELLHLLRGEPVPAPPEIVEAFPRLRASTWIQGQQPLF